MMKIHEAHQAHRELPKKCSRAKMQGEIAQLAQTHRELPKRCSRAKL